MDEIFEMFQTAYAGAPYLPEDESDSPAEGIVEIGLMGERTVLEGSAAARLAGGQDRPLSQLDAVVARIRDVARDAGIEPVQGFWVPPLPVSVALEELKPAAAWTGAGWQPSSTPLAPVIGLLDDPARQEQRPLGLPLEQEGHLAVFGAPGSGKTTFLQTLTLSLVQDAAPDRVQLYLLDFGGRSLKLFERFPHVGAVIQPDESERLQRLFRHLLAELETRKTLLAASGAGTMSVYRAHQADAPAAIVLAIDNYKEFADAFPALIDPLAKIAGQGASLGVHIVLTSSLINAIPTRLMSAIPLTIALELNDQSDYSLVVGRTGGLYPERSVPGRGLIKQTPPLEFQTALPVAGEGSRIAAIRTLADRMHAAWTGPLPSSIPTLPLVVPFRDLPAVAEPAPGVAIGLDAETLGPVSVDLADGPHFLIAGPPGSGKSTLLQTWLLALAEATSPEQTRLYLPALAGSTFWPFRRLPHVAAFVDDDAGMAPVLGELSAELDRRRALVDEARKAERSAIEVLAGLPRLIVAIDDFDQFRTSCADPNRTALEGLMRRSRGLGFFVLIAGPSAEFGSTWGVVGKAIKESQTGFLLGSTDHTDLGIFNLRLPSDETGKQLNPGRGYSIRRGRRKLIQVATCHETATSLADRIAALSTKWASTAG
jgi:S-DNA-T family DNA segregation ATPase FtsK/SpoIIIE